MDANLLTAFGALFTAVGGFIIAIYTMRTSANRELVDRLSSRLDEEVKLRKSDREQWEKEREVLKKELKTEIDVRENDYEELSIRLEKVIQERDFYKKALFDEQESHRKEIEKLKAEWKIEQDGLIIEIEKMKRQINTKRRQ